MKRPLFFGMLAFVAGIYGANVLPGFFLPTVMAGLGAFLLGAALFRKLPIIYGVLCLCFLAGSCYLVTMDRATVHPLYPYRDEYVTLTVDVLEEPQVNEETGRVTLVARVNHLSFLEEEVLCKETVRMTIDVGGIIPAFGERFRAVCLLELPTNSGSSHDLDFALYLKSKEIFFLASVEEETVEILGTYPLGLREKMYQLNRRTGKVIMDLLPPTEASVLQAISLGDKTDMPPAFYEALKVSGLSHMAAVSGMHVTTLLMTVYYFLLILKQNRYRYFLPLIFLVLLFMLFTGSSPSVVRASVMSILSLSAYLFMRKEDPLTSLGVAAGLIALKNPFLVFDIGFILSFGATLGILIFARPMTDRLLSFFRLIEPEGRLQRGMANLLTMICVSLSAQLMILPLAAWIFGYLSLWSILTTLLVTPLLPVLLLGGLLTGFLGLLYPGLPMLFLGVVYLYAKVFTWIVVGFGKLTFGVVTLGRVTLFSLYLYSLFLFGVYAFLKGRRNRVIVCSSVCGFLICLSLAICLLFPVAQITFVPVGQGDCTLFELPGGERILLDGGGNEFDTGYDIGKEIVVPYLRRRGVRKLSYVIASHPHADHIEGLEAVIESIPVETLLIPEGFTENDSGKELVTLAESQGISISDFSAGEILSLKRNCSFECLLPDERWLKQTDNENDHSLVCRFRFGDSVALFPGDLESAGEAYLTETVLPESVDLLKVGHHGSETSSGQKFLEWSEPDYAFIPCGKNNFGHPAESVLKRLYDMGVVVYRGDYDRDVTFILSKTGVRSVRTGGVKP